MSIIYFDNAATTFKKPKEVLAKTIHYLKKGYGNAGRSGHYLSMQTAEMIYDTRDIISQILHYENPNRIVFYHNATEALNVAIKTCIPEGANVLTSYMEHNSVLRPLYSMEAERRISITFFSHKGNIEENIKNKLSDQTQAIVCSLVSNVTGEEIDLSILSKLKKEYNLILIVDASQMFCHKEINLKENEVDVLCTAGHKGAFSMQGVGFSVFNIDPSRTYIEGGSGLETFSHGMPSALPERMEAGTLSAPAIASLFFGLKYVQKIGMDKIERKLDYFDQLIDNELELLSDIHVLSKGKHGIHSFVFSNEMSSTTAKHLEKKGICVRSGYHCAPLIHKFYKTETTGAVRVSLSIMNTEKEIKRFLSELKK